MKFQVPQFIETETKIIGPFTLKQFLFVASGIALSVMEFILFSGIVLMILVLITCGFFGALAFLKVDGQPLLNYLAYMLAYGLGAKRYIYKPEDKISP